MIHHCYHLFSPLAFIGKQWLGGAAHAKFSRDVVEQSCVMFLNTCILSTYLPSADAHAVWTAIVLLSVFRYKQSTFYCIKN